MCDYCKNMKSIFINTNWRESPIREVYIELDKTITISSNLGGEDCFDSINFKINYCPMCGNKLEIE